MAATSSSSRSTSSKESRANLLQLLLAKLQMQ
jgi:hypothetical protein